MNRKGQTLVLFIVLLPIFAFLGFYVYDLGMQTLYNSRINSVTRLIIKDNMSNIDNNNINELIKDDYSRNNYKTNDLKINIKNNSLTITNCIEYNNIFGFIIDDNKVINICTKLTGYYDNDKIIIEKG